MAQSLTERVTALERALDVHIARLDALSTQVKGLEDKNSDAAKAFAALKQEFDREAPLLKREVEELKKWREDSKKEQEEWGRKLWAILPPLLAVFISNALTLAIALYLRK